MSGVDVDIYINSVYLLENQEELEHVVKRFRASKRTVNTLDSTHHAVCRFFLGHGKRDQLLKILNERVQYGIFPDTFMYNVLLDNALKEGALEDAFEVVKLLTLQEDSGNEITKTLVLHTLNQLLVQDLVGPKPAAEGATEEAPEEEAEVDEDDIEYIRVPYLTNPYFDDHFELTNRDHIFGKALYFFGLELGKSSKTSDLDQVLSASAQIIGLIFYQKWDKLDKVLNRLKSSEITSDPVEIARKHAELIKDEEIQSKLQALIPQLEAMPRASELKLKSLIDVRTAALSSQEPADIEAQKAMFAGFETTRLEAIKSQLDALLREQKRIELDRQKDDLEKKKRLYYFFENFPKHEIDFVAAEQRIKEIQSTTVVDEEYIPPERY